MSIKVAYHIELIPETTRNKSQNVLQQNDASNHTKTLLNICYRCFKERGSYTDAVAVTSIRAHGKVQSLTYGATADSPKPIINLELKNGKAWSI